MAEKYIPREFKAFSVETLSPSAKTAYCRYMIGDYGTCVVYRAGEDKYFFLYEDGKIGISKNPWEDEGIKYIDPKTEDGKKIAEEAAVLRVRDRTIHELRASMAHKMAGGDPLLERVLTCAVEFSHGHEPYKRVIDGVDLYTVGENASHQAMLGVRDGRVYLFSSSGEDVYLLPDNSGEEVCVDKVLDRVLYSAFCQWHEFEATDEEIQSMIGCDRDKIFAEDNFELLFNKFKEKFGETIGRAVREAILEFKDTRQVPDGKNEIIIPMGEGWSFCVYIKSDLTDVTDQKEVYVGRGAYVNFNELEKENSGGSVN